MIFTMSKKDRKALGMVVGAAGVIMAAKSISRRDTPSTQASLGLAVLGLLLSL